MSIGRCDTHNGHQRSSQSVQCEQGKRVNNSSSAHHRAQYGQNGHKKSVRISRYEDMGVQGRYGGCYGPFEALFGACVSGGGNQILLSRIRAMTMLCVQHPEHPDVCVPGRFKHVPSIQVESSSRLRACFHFERIY
eukprot:157268-Prorocentrum_minimum.AAC.1